MHTYNSSDSKNAYAEVATVSFNDVTVVIPTLNECEAVVKVIDKLKREGFQKIIVVNGYSNDGTVDIAKQKGVSVVFQHGAGKTGALKTNIERLKISYLLVMNSDFTCDSKDIERFLAHGQRFAQVMGVRSRFNISSIHRLDNWVITHAFNLMFDSKLSDVCSGMYLLKTDIAKQIDLISNGFITEVAAQMVAEHSITEVPINYRPRISRGTLEAWNGFCILLAVIHLARKYKPVSLFSAFSGLTAIPAMCLLGWAGFQQFTTDIWYSSVALIGAIMLLFATQSIAIATISVQIKRTEQRMVRRLEGRMLS
jgi:dolichol-phosphate mannosyltransferase